MTIANGFSRQRQRTQTRFSTSCQPFDFRAAGIRGCGLDVATHHVPCHVVATRHTHRHVRGPTTISTELVGSAPDMVHVLRFPTYVRSRVRRLNGNGVPYPEHGYVRNRHDVSLSIAVNASTALSFRKLPHHNCELLDMLIEWRII